VDGKLARVTVRSSKVGHVLDHGMDILHPPFWYVFWGMSLPSFSPFLGIGQAEAYWWVVAAYVLGRVVEGVFPVLGDCTIFTWRPFDAWFRLVTARRNPCLIILTVATAAGRPEIGFVGVVLWSIFTTAVLILRLALGLGSRMGSGPLSSWMADRDAAAERYPTSFRLFAATRSAYGGA
jgi:hypothetical protein